MAQLSITIDDVRVKRMLNTAEKALGVPSISQWFYLHADPHMRDSFKDNFLGSKESNGTAWAEWSEGYKKKDRGHAILRKTGGLMRSVTTTRGQLNQSMGTDGLSMSWGGNIRNFKYRIHQLGSDPPNPDGTEMGGKNHNIRQWSRPMVGFNNSDSIYLTESLAGWFGKMIQMGMS